MFTSNIRRLIIVAGIIFILTGISQARQGVYVNCQQGGQAVVLMGINSTNFVMASYPGCTITVKINGTGTDATIFSDNAGTPLGNPFTASLTDGHGVFYADNGRYDIQLSGGSPSPGISPTLTISDVLLNDPASSLGCSALPALTGDITSAGATCTTVLPSIATAGTGLKTTINVKGQATAVTTAASTDLSDSANLPRLNTANAFVGNQTITGNVSAVQGIFSGVVQDAGETASGEVAPTVTGLLLGDNAHRWDAFIRNLDVSGTVSGVDTGTGSTNRVTKFLNGITGVIGNSGIIDDGTTVSTSELFTVSSTGNIQQITSKATADANQGFSAQNLVQNWTFGVRQDRSEAWVLRDVTNSIDLFSVDKTTGKVTSPNFNGGVWLDGVKYSSLANAYAACPTATYAASGDGIGTVWTGGGGKVEVPPAWIDPAWGANLVLKNNCSIHFNGPAYFNQGTFQVTMANGVHGVNIINDSAADHSQRTSGVTFDYSGNGDAWAIGSAGGRVSNINIENIQIHTINGGTTAQPFHLVGPDYSTFRHLDVVCSSNSANTGFGMLYDGGGVGESQNYFEGMVPNFCNNPIKFQNNASGNTWKGGIPTCSGGSACVAASGNPVFSIVDSNNNMFIGVNNGPSAGSFASFFNFSGTSSGNRVWSDKASSGTFVTTTAVFGASTVDNIYYCLLGGCNFTDSSAQTSGNQVVDSSKGAMNPVGFFHNNSINANTGTQTVLASAAVVTGLYWWMNECHTKTSGTGTTASFTLGWNNESGAQTFTSGTFALNTTTFATASVAVNFYVFISSGAAVTTAISGTWGTSVAECSSNLMRVQ